MANIVNSNGPCAIVGRATLFPPEDRPNMTAYLPNQNTPDWGYESNRYNLKSICKELDYETILPFTLNYLTGSFNISNSNTVVSTGHIIDISTFSLQNFSQNISANENHRTNFRAVLSSFNTNHYWKDLTFPCWSAYEINLDAFPGNPILSSDTYKQIYTYFEDKATTSTDIISIKTLSSISVNESPIYATSNVRINSNQPYLNDVFVSTSGTNPNISFGYEAIIYGEGLTNYIQNLPNLKNINKLFAVKIKGGYSLDFAANYTGTENCLTKLYTFDKNLDIGNTEFSYKALNETTNLYLIKDEFMGYLNLKIPYMISREKNDYVEYFVGPTIPGHTDNIHWVPFSSNSTKFSNDTNAYDVMTAYSSYEPDYNYSVVTGDYCTYLSQPYFFDCNAAKFNPKEGSKLYHFYGIEDGITYYYCGDTRTYQGNWTTNNHTSAMAAFMTTADIGPISSQIINDPLFSGMTNISLIEDTGQDGDVGLCAYNPYEPSYLFNMPEIKIMALKYIFRP